MSCDHTLNQALVRRRMKSGDERGLKVALVVLRAHHVRQHHVHWTQSVAETRPPSSERLNTLTRTWNRRKSLRPAVKHLLAF